jgi:ATPase subunit of ABC transporter with duplicated ATPase domains
MFLAGVALKGLEVAAKEAKEFSSLVSTMKEEKERKERQEANQTQQEQNKGSKENDEAKQSQQAQNEKTMITCPDSKNDRLLDEIVIEYQRKIPLKGFSAGYLFPNEAKFR